MVYRFTSIHAFTVLEMLMGVCILGLVSMVAAPSLYQTVIAPVTTSRATGGDRNGVFRDTLGQLKSVLAGAASQGGQSQSSLFIIGQGLHGARCTQSLGTLNTDFPGDQTGCILNNGAWVFNLQESQNTVQAMNIDWNGNEAPNQWGEDRMAILASWDAAPKSLIWGNTMVISLTENVSEIGAGDIIPLKGPSRTLYDTLY
jgi:type II secretory pathway pseudopilin PulG